MISSVLLMPVSSGHGKTYMAENMGRFLGIPYHKVDCAEMRHFTDLFGPKYIGASEGTPLNKFLHENSDKRAIVLLDEFEKTREEVWNGFIQLFDKGGFRCCSLDVAA